MAELHLKGYLCNDYEGIIALREKKSEEDCLYYWERNGHSIIDSIESFAKEYVKIPELIKTQISDILYDPKDNDQTRLKFIMDNGKIFYLRIEDMADQLNRIDYEAFMTGYSDRCVFSFEGNYIYTEECE